LQKNNIFGQSTSLQDFINMGTVLSCCRLSLSLIP
jgi:hypothetical protein